MPLHFWDTKTFKLQDEGWENDMSVARLVHAKNELFFFQTYFYGQVAVQFLVPLQNSEKT